MKDKVYGVITIKFNKEEAEKAIWSPSRYTEYFVTKTLFVVKNGDQWVGIYPLENIRSIEVI